MDDKHMANYIAANRETWNQWMARNVETDHYKDVDRYRQTGSSLRPIELAELGDVSGKSLLHLQCNLGSETLSWARRGARVTGIDISDHVIAFATSLASESGLSHMARFIRSDVYDLPNALDEQFDVVVASYGAICWGPDIDRWMAVAARYVAPGGIFLLIDLHPIGMAVDIDAGDTREPRFRVTHSYFHTPDPIIETGNGKEPIYSWRYGVGEVVSAATRAGLVVASVNEYPFAHWRQFPQLIDSGDGYWRWPDDVHGLPLLFSLRAQAPVVPPR